MENETDAQKKEIEKAEPLEDMTPEGDVSGGSPHVKVFDGRSGGISPGLDAQKKEVEDV